MLSICIPTHNRSDYLDKTLASITSQPIFRDSDAIEVCISDNASTDATAETVQQYMAQFPNKIRYRRNASNNGDRNHADALLMGQKSFCKLHNDNLPFRSSALEQLLRFLSLHKEAKPVVFMFHIRQLEEYTTTQFATASDFFARISHYCTWIGGFGLWREDRCLLDEHDFYAANTQLAHVAILCALGRKAERELRKFCVYEQDFVELVQFQKGGYNVAQVFGNNFMELLLQYPDVITPETFKKLKFDVFVKHIVPYYFDMIPIFHSHKGDFWKHTRHFHNTWYFYAGIIAAMCVQVFPKHLRLQALRNAKTLIPHFWCAKKERHLCLTA